MEVRKVQATRGRVLDDEISREKVIRVGAYVSDFLVVLLIKKRCQAKYLAVLDGDLRFHMIGKEQEQFI